MSLLTRLNAIWQKRPSPDMIGGGYCCIWYVCSRLYTALHGVRRYVSGILYHSGGGALCGRCMTCQACRVCMAAYDRRRVLHPIPDNKNPCTKSAGVYIYWLFVLYNIHLNFIVRAYCGTLQSYGAFFVVNPKLAIVNNAPCMDKITFVNIFYRMAYLHRIITVFWHVY